MKIENVAVISLEYYAEYQELKKSKNSIDYNKLKTGSVVMLKRTGNHCNGAESVDFSKPFSLILKDCNHFISENNGFYLSKRLSRNYNTFFQNGKFIHFITYDVDYITEVVEY